MERSPDQAETASAHVIGYPTGAARSVVRRYEAHAFSGEAVWGPRW